MEPTIPQIDYVEGMRRSLKLTKSLLDIHCRVRFDKPLADLDRRQCSDLIEEMIGWKVIQDQLMREAGQQSLF